MGIYPNHGVEYWVEIDKNFDNNELKAIVEKIKIDAKFNIYVTPINSICVLSTSRTDDRLVKSNYYKERKHDWFNQRTLSMEWRESVTEQSSIDIELNEDEKNILHQIREQLGEHITYEGWFDVNTIGYSF
jgi:uncharacterized membrane protein